MLALFVASYCADAMYVQMSLEPGSLIRTPKFLGMSFFNLGSPTFAARIASRQRLEVGLPWARPPDRVDSEPMLT